MRLTLVCKRYYTNKDLIADKFGRLYHFPKYLSAAGNDVWVEAIDYRGEKAKIQEVEGVFYRTIPINIWNVISLPCLLYDYCKNVTPDIVVASGDSYIGFLSLLIAKKLCIPFVFDVYDYYPVFKGNRIPGMKTMFRYAVRKADLVLCASESLQEKLTGLNEKTLLVENGVDIATFKPMKTSLARTELELEDGVWIGYFGSINEGRGPLLIDACRILRHEFSNLRLLLAGKVDEVSLCESWIRYLGELPHDTIPTLINACDVVTIPYADTPFNQMCGACKIAEYLACGTPVVATKISVPSLLFDDVPSAVCEATAESMAESIRQQLLNRHCPVFPRQLEWKAISDKLHSSLLLL